MIRHTDTHAQRPSVASMARRRPCHSATWEGFGADAFGIDRCNPLAETIVDGLRYSTRTATLIAAADGEEYGVYLFRTTGGRFFAVRHHYPLRYDRSDPLDVLSVNAALTLYAAIAAKPWATVDPIAEAFPNVEVLDA